MEIAQIVFVLMNSHGLTSPTIKAHFMDMLNVLAEVFAIEKPESANALMVMKERLAPELLAPTIAVGTELANLSTTSHTRRSTVITACRDSPTKLRL